MIKINFTTAGGGKGFVLVHSNKHFALWLKAQPDTTHITSVEYIDPSKVEV